jgi:hypothetical protein
MSKEDHSVTAHSNKAAVENLLSIIVSLSACGAGGGAL